MITYTDTDVVFEESDTAMSILISNDGSILHNNFSEDKEKAASSSSDASLLYGSSSGVCSLCEFFTC